MFYSSPKHFYQHLHNKLGAAILKSGQVLGYLSIDLSPDGQTVTRGFKSIVKWTTFSSLIQLVAMLFYLFYYIFFVRVNEHKGSVLSFVLGTILDSVVVLFVATTFTIVIFGRLHILKLVTFVINLKKVFSTLKSYGNLQKKLVYINWIGITFAICLNMCFTIILIFNFILHPGWFKLIIAIMKTLIYCAYIFVVIIYGITFSYGFFLMRKLFDNLRREHCQRLALYHYLLLKFLRKVNFFMQIMVYFCLCDVFIGLVINVSSDVILNCYRFL